MSYTTDINHLWEDLQDREKGSLALQELFHS